MRTKTCIFLAVLAMAIMIMPAGMASSSEADGAFTLTVVSDHGLVVNDFTGQPFESGPLSGSITLRFYPNAGQELVEWKVQGTCISQPDGNLITISGLEESVTVTAVARNYSTSQELFNIIDSYGTPVPGDILVNNWSFCSTELNRTGNEWEGMPCTPLIVGNVAYVRAGGILYALNISSGTILHSVASPGIISYYHYISYGNGVIFDTVGHRAYDLDLNYLYNIPENLKYASFHNGYFYGCLSTADGYTMFKTSADIDKDLKNSTKINLFQNKEAYQVWAQYGQFSNVIFENGYFFFLQADGQTGKHGWRALTAINLETEVSTTIELSGFTGMPWDDGWLSYYNGYFYLTAYTAGLFGGVIGGLEEERSSLMWVKFNFDTGTFNTPQYEWIRTDDGKTFRGIASGLEIYNGRGYLNVRSLGTDTLGGSDDAGSRMIAYNIAEDGRPIPDGKASTQMTHGGIVVNTAYESEGKIYIYLLPYNMGSQGLYVFTDEYKDGRWQLVDHYTYLNPNSRITEYSSQAPRAGPDGEMIFYLDHGYLQCVKAISRFSITVTTIEGEHATVRSECGRNASEVLAKLYPGSTISGSQITIGSKVYNMYGLNEVTWSYEELTDPVAGRYVASEMFGTTDAIYSQIAIVEQNTDPHFTAGGEKGWYFFGDSGFEKCNIRNRAALDAAMGCTLIYSLTKPTSDAAFLMPYMSLARGSSTQLELPAQLESTVEVDDDTIISAVREGDTVTVTALKEDTAKITFNVGGKVYEMSVDVMPKVRIEGGDTITESIKSRPTADGGRVDSTFTTTSNDEGIETVSTIKTYDADGNLLTTELTERNVINSEISQFMDGQLAEVDEYEQTVTDANDSTTVHIQYRKELISKGSQDGTLRTDIIEANLDVLTGILTKTVTVKISNMYYTSTTTTVTVEKNSQVIDEKTQQDVESSSKGVVAKVEDGATVIEIENGSTGDLEKMLNALDGADGKPVKVNAGDIIDSAIFDSVADLDADVVMNTGNASITLGPEAVKALSGKGNVSFTAVAANPVNMTQKQKDAAGEAKVFSIDLKCGDDFQHQFGVFTIELDCDLQAEDGKVLRVWRIDEYGQKTLADNVSYENGKLRFTADHLSYYAAGFITLPSGTEGGDNGDLMLYLGIGIAAIAVIGIAGFAAMRRR